MPGALAPRDSGGGGGRGPGPGRGLDEAAAPLAAALPLAARLRLLHGHPTALLSGLPFLPAQRGPPALSAGPAALSG